MVDREDPPTGSPRAVALHYLNLAKRAGAKGDLREAIDAALEVGTTARRGALTDLAYRRLEPGRTLADPERPGFIARATKSGTTFYYRFAHPETGKQTEHKLGDYPATTLAQAREAWAPLRAARLKGLAPTHTPASPGAMPSLGAICKLYLDEYASVHKRSWKEDKRLLAREVLPEYADLPADQFTAKEVSAILLRIKARGANREAEKARALLSTLFNVARGKSRKLGSLHGSWLPISLPNPVDGVYLDQRVAKETFTPKRSELARFLAGLRACALSEDHRDILLLQLQTASRIGEVAGLRWDELDGEAPSLVWTLPSSRAKNGLRHKVMLAEQSQALLEARRPLAKLSPFVFPSARTRAEPIRPDAVGHALARALPALDLPAGFTSHSLRHAALTWMAENGIHREVRDRVSNHRPEGRVDRVYTRNAELDADARASLQRWCDYLDVLVAPNVVPISSSTSPRKRA